MKSIVLKIAEFYVRYKTDSMSVKRRFWRDILFEFFPESNQVYWDNILNRGKNK